MCVTKKAAKEKTPSASKSVSGRASQKSNASLVKPPPAAPSSTGMPSTAKQPASNSQKPLEQTQAPTDKKSSIMKKSLVVKSPAEPATPASGRNAPSSPVWKEQQPPATPEPEHIAVEPPKLMYARRRIDQVRPPKDPLYKTLEDEISEWESARIMKRVELEKYDTKPKPSKEKKEENTKGSKVASKKESAVSRKASNVSRKGSKAESKVSKKETSKKSRKEKNGGETVSNKEEGPKDDTVD